MLSTRLAHAETSISFSITTGSPSARPSTSAVKLERVAGQDLGIAIEVLGPELVEGTVDRELLHGLERDLRTGSRRRHREARRHRARRAGLGDQHQLGERRRRGRGMVVDQCS